MHRKAGKYKSLGRMDSGIWDWLKRRETIKNAQNPASVEVWISAHGCDLHIYEGVINA